MALIHPNKSPFPSESLVVYVKFELPELTSSDATVIVIGDEAQPTAEPIPLPIIFVGVDA